MRHPLILANWKMHGSRAFVERFCAEFVPEIAELSVDVEIALLPPYVLLESVRRQLMPSGCFWGVQDVSAQAEGAYSGEISAGMLQDWGCLFCLVGHSERRQYQGDTDATIARKFIACMAVGVTPVLCVGETAIERETGQAETVVLRQLCEVLDAWKAWGNKPQAPLVIAYEPVWAIGTGVTATPQEAESMHCLIREHLKRYNGDLSDTTRILYGGSVKPDNAAQLFSQPNIDGGLVGGASLVSEQLIKVIQQCSNCYCFST